MVVDPVSRKALADLQEEEQKETVRHTLLKGLYDQIITLQKTLTSKREYESLTEELQALHELYEKIDDMGAPQVSASVQAVYQNGEFKSFQKVTSSYPGTYRRYFNQVGNFLELAAHHPLLNDSSDSLLMAAHHLQNLLQAENEVLAIDKRMEQLLAGQIKAA
jgi:hypothetical protein